MKRVPQRSRSHVIETKSQIALRRALPAEWVIDNVEHDYGIDRRVLLCDAEGRLTGQEFGVQLKGTDDQSAQGLRVAVRWDHCAFWGSLPYPVMVVRYISGSERLYGIWSHDRGRDFFDLDLEKAWFRFGSRDELTADRIGALPSELDRFHQARSRSIRLPVVLHAPTGEPLELSRLNRELSQLAGSSVSVVGGPTASSPVKLEIDKGFAVDFGAGLAVRVHQRGSDAGGVNARDLLVVVGVCLGQMGAFDDLELCLQAGAESALLQQPDFLCQAIGALTHGGRHALLLDVLSRSEVDPAVISALLGMVSARMGAIAEPASSETAARISEHLLQRFSKADRGVAVFNHAGNLRSLGRHEEAVTQYKLALDLRESYHDEAVYWTVRGGSEFLSRQWIAAARSYSKARDLGDDDLLTREMWLEATLHSGSYETALEAGRSFADPSPTEMLVRWTADRVMKRFGILEQSRTDEAIGEGLAARQHLTAPFPEEVCRDVATFDPLEPMIWLAATDSANPVLDVLIGAFLADDARAWASALVLAAGAGTPSQQLGPWVERAGRGHSNLQVVTLDVLEELTASGFAVDEREVSKLFAAIHEATNRGPRPFVTLISSNPSTRAGT